MGTMFVSLRMVKQDQGKLTQWYSFAITIEIKMSIQMNDGVCIYCFVHQTGPDGASEKEWGVNYRALNDLFKISQSRKSNISYEVGVQMVEIYNEQVRDLLSGDTSQKKYPFFCSFKCCSSILLYVLSSFCVCHPSVLLDFSHTRDSLDSSTKRSCCP